MAFSTSLLFLFALLPFLSLSLSAAADDLHPPVEPPSPPPHSLLNAVETLSNCHYNAMALTLEVLLDQPPSLVPFPSPLTLTVFAPLDSAFISSGQPSLSLLLLHFSPLSFSQRSLSSLPYSSVIPTLSPSHTPLYITTNTISPDNSSVISINGVSLSPLPLYDDGFVVVYGIDRFFQPNFTLINPNPNPNPNPVCMEFSKISRFSEASSVLKSRGFSIMGSFLDLQLIGFVGSEAFLEMKLTLFAPADEALVGYSGNFLDYSSLFLRHLLPCKLSWSDLNAIPNGTNFDHYVEAYNIKIEKLDDDIVMVNGVKITAPEMYKNGSIVVHGLQQLIPVSDHVEEELEQISLVKLVKKVEDVSTSPNNGEF